MSTNGKVFGACYAVHYIVVKQQLDSHGMLCPYSGSEPMYL